MSLTNFPNGVSSFGVPVLPGMPTPFTGKYFFVDPVNGSDGNTGTDPSRAFATIYKAYSRCTAGKNDCVFLISDGTTASTARLSLALAQSVDSTATTGTLTWAKNATHLIGISSSSMNPRARLAPPTGTYTQATFASGNFVVVTAAGCSFQNISVFHGFSTGGNSQIAWTDSGGRNSYDNVFFGGAADAASAQSTSSRSLLVSGSGENVFRNCTIGLDTVTKTVANASLEFAAGTTRNTFEACRFPFQTSAATPLGILATGNASIDRWQLFRGCTFMNNVNSTSTTMSVLASCTTASPGGMFVFQQCTLVGITKFGDTNALAVSWIDGGAPAAATTGLAVNPS